MLTTFNILAVSQVARTINLYTVKYSELGNVKFTLRIVAQFLCGCGLELARVALARVALARMIVVPEWLRGSI